MADQGGAHLQGQLSARLPPLLQNCQRKIAHQHRLFRVNKIARLTSNHPGPDPRADVLGATIRAASDRRASAALRDP